MPADKTLGPRGLPLPSAVSLYRSRFIDCAAGAVQYSYRNFDLLWDNAIAGPRGNGPAYGASEVPARREPLDGSGTLTIAQLGEICDPALAQIGSPWRAPNPGCVVASPGPSLWSTAGRGTIEIARDNSRQRILYVG
jgi:hypothetical protein